MSYATQRMIWAMKGLGHRDKMVLLCLDFHRNDDTGRCDPTQETISEETGYARGQVEIAIGSLKSRGRIGVHKREGVKGRRNFYTLNLNGSEQVNQNDSQQVNGESRMTQFESTNDSGRVIPMTQFESTNDSQQVMNYERTANVNGETNVDVGDGGVAERKTPKPLIAQFDGKCPSCKGPIYAGEEITSYGMAKGSRHFACPWPPRKPGKAKVIPPTEDAGGLDKPIIEYLPDDNAATAAAVAAMENAEDGVDFGDAPVYGKAAGTIEDVEA